MRRKISIALMCAILIAILSVPLGVFAEDNTPVLTSISFKNAVPDQKFSSDVQEYTVTLVDNQESATLESYKISGDADIFVNYNYDETSHPKGISVTIQYETGSLIYNFIYSNPAQYEVNDDNTLASIYCTYGEISPQLNEEDTAYKLYIPSDLTQLIITPATRDIHAYCAPVQLTLDDNQTPKITLYSVASDGSKKEYSLSIKRVDKTTAQVKAELENGVTSFVDGTRLYQRPEFIIVVSAVAGGIAIIFILFALTRRIVVNPYDKDEKPFYTPID